MSKKYTRGWLIGSATAAIAIVAVSAFGSGLVTHGPAMGAGVAAQLGCAGVFLMDRDLDEVEARDVERLNPLTAMFDLSVDRNARTVTASLFGLTSRSAYYRPGIGCTLIAGTSTHELDSQVQGLETMTSQPRTGLWPEGDDVDLDALPMGVDRSALIAAVAAAFEDPAPEKGIDTRAVVVVHDGRIVAERYAPGFDRDSRFLGWSMSKSVTGALIGMLVEDGRLSLDAPAPVPEWSAPGDPRAAITLRNMLNMASGLSFIEHYLPGDDSTVMLFESADMGGYAALRPLVHPPGSSWSYSSGTTNLLSRIVRDATGGSLKSAYEFARHRLFEPAGMTSAVFQPDGSGVPVGSSFMYATARDWARFGQLFLGEGEINGRRLLSRQWVAFSREPVDVDPLRHYGAHFWLNEGNPSAGHAPMLDRCPPDMYMARGHNAQILAIVPSKRAVIVRLGWTEDGHTFDANTVFSRILAALP
jgi:CubicO group peptidase (beta-lactamase class C family)